jgi:hypothetical protein
MILNLKISKLLILFFHLKRISPHISKGDGIKLKGAVMLATKCDIVEISDDDTCYALICKRALFSLDDIASLLPPAVTTFCRSMRMFFHLRYPRGCHL